jgi:hypothetical protein
MLARDRGLLSRTTLKAPNTFGLRFMLFALLDLSEEEIKGEVLT